MPSDLGPVVRKLSTHSILDEADRAAILAAPHSLRTLEPGAFITREGDKPQYCALILSGLACRHKVTAEGARQITSIHLPGELVDLHNIFLTVSDHNIQTLTRVEVATMTLAAVDTLTGDFPNVGRAMWIDTLIDAAIFREWVVNIGRRDAISRVAHLLCEFAVRLESLGLADDHAYDLPMTQDQIADAVGLTPVHINRVLKELAEKGLIVRNKRTISIPDWAKLSHVGDFTSRYLHLEQLGKDESGERRFFR